MKVFYWFLKCLNLGIFVLTSPFVYDQTGWWGAIVFILLMVWGENYLNDKLRLLKKHKINERFPVLKELESGDRVTLTLKNGKVFSDFVYSFFTEYDIIISKKTMLEQLLEDKDDSKWININKISAIEKSSD